MTSNWGGVSVPDSGDVAQFAAASYSSVAAVPDLTSPADLGGIWDTGAGSITIGGSALTLYGATIDGNAGTGIEMDATRGPLTINAPLVLQNSQTWYNNSGSTLTVNGNISGGSLAMLGSGPVVLAGANTFTYATIDAGCTLQMPGGSIASPSQYVGFNSSGSFTQSGGVNSLTATGTLYLGQNAGSSGSYNLSGGSLFATFLEVGVSGNGSFTQSAGTNSVGGLYLAFDGGSSGSYSLSDGLLSVGSQIIVGWSGSGSFMQTGGTNSGASQLYVGLDGSGTYNLGGSGLLSSGAEYVGNSGSGSFTQSGGTNTATSVLALGTSAGASGTYNLNGGLLVLSGSGLTSGSGSTAFNFTGGTLQAGSSWTTSVPIMLPSIDSSGTINTNGFTVTLNGPLSGPGGLTKLGAGALVLTAYNSYAGDTIVDGGTLQMPSGSLASANQYIGYSGTGSFTQTGGTNSTSYMYIGNGSGYLLSGSGRLAAQSEEVVGALRQTGGTNAVSFVQIVNGSYMLSVPLQIGGGLQLFGGTLEGGGSTASITASNSIVDLSGGSVVNFGSGSLSIGPNSLLIVPPEFNPAAAFRHYSNLGLTHTAGTTLNVSAGTGFGGWGTIYDFVNCQGSISATPSGYISLPGGLYVSGTGQVNLGNGALFVDTTSPASGIGGGSLTADLLGVGEEATASFSQTAGNVSLAAGLDLGVNLTSANLNAAYNLNGGQLSASSENIGYSSYGTAVSASFTQSGGTHSVSSGVVLGANSGSIGTYNLNGGLFLLAGNFALSAGTGSANFNFGGGTLGATAAWSSSLAMTLTGNGGNATIDTTGGDICLSGALSGPGGLNKVGSGTLTLSGSNTFIGNTSVDGGTLAMSGGLLSSPATGILTLASTTGSSGNFYLSGGSISIAYEYAGYLGPGTFTQTGGTNSVLGDLGLGFNPTSFGTYCLSSSGALSAGNLKIQSGIFNQAAGTSVFTQAIYDGYDGSVTGATCSLSGGSLSSPIEYVGYNAQGAFLQSGGTNSAGILTLAGTTGSSGNFYLSGGSLSSAYEYAGYLGPGTFTQTGGTNSVLGDLGLGFNPTSFGTYCLSSSGHFRRAI